MPVTQRDGSLILWKALIDRKPVVADVDYQYPIGQWTKHLDPEKLDFYHYGYHYAEGSFILGWITEGLYTVEACPDHDPLRGSDMLVTCRMRLTRVPGWNPDTMIQFAEECTERVAHLDNWPTGDALTARDARAARYAKDAAKCRYGITTNDIAEAAGYTAEYARAAARRTDGIRDPELDCAEMDWQYKRFCELVGVTP